MSKEFIIDIDKVGRPTINAEGFTGTSCKDKALPLLKALGAAEGDTVVEDKPEIHQTDNQGASQSW